jgi:hypothetical protein
MVNFYIIIMVSIEFLTTLFFNIFIILFDLFDSTMVILQSEINKYNKTNFIDHLFELVKFHNACLTKHNVQSQAYFSPRYKQYVFHPLNIS